MKLFYCLTILLTTFPVLAQDLEQKHQQLLYPVVRVRTANSGGSGTVIYSEDRDERGLFRSYILTNHHVVDNAITVAKKWDNLRQRYQMEENNALVDVEIFSWFRGTIINRTTVRAEIVAHSSEDDIAVLELKSNDQPYPVKLDYVSKLAADATFKSLTVFQPIFVVGCSLGHDPIHSTGDITDLSDILDGKSYMMGSASVIFGNSGGAVFTALGEHYVLIGIPARVAVAGYAGAITHMNWFVPQDRIVAFIRGQKLDFLIDEKATPAKCFSERAKIRESAPPQTPDSEGSDSPHHDGEF